MDLYCAGDIVRLTADCDDSVYRDSDGAPVDVRIGDEIEAIDGTDADGMCIGRVLRSGDTQAFHWSELELVHRPINNPAM